MLCWNICMYLFYLRSYFILLLWDRTCISKVIKNCRLHTVIFPDNSVNKESPCNAWDPGSIPGSRRSPREGNGNSLQYSCLRNSADRVAWWATVHGVTKSWTWLSNWAHTSCYAMLSLFSHVRLCVTPEMAAHQAPPSLGFSRQEHWSGLQFPSPMHESEKWKWSLLVMSNSSWPHGLQPTRLLRPWDFPGKSTGVGCHCLLRGLV